MPHPVRSPKVASALLPFATIALAAAVFIADTITPMGVAVAVLYVAVVLMAARFCPPRGVMLVAAGCVLLAAASFLASYPQEQAEAVANDLISIAAIGVTTLLILQSQSAETRLREQASLLDLTHDTIFVRSMDDVITYWNRGAEELYGWSQAEALGKVSHQLTQTVFPAPLEEINAELLRCGRWEGVLIHTKRDASRVTVASRWSLQRDKQGRPAMILETNNDITERTRAEERLRESEEQWKAVFENNPTMFFIVDATGAVVSVNPYGAEQLGYTVEELIASPVQNMFHEADREAAVRNTASCLEHIGEAMSWELRKVRKNGEMLWVRETARAILIKNRPVVLVVCEDITERKQAEYLTRHVFESSPDGICIIGRDYRYQRVNAGQVRIWRMPAEDIIDHHIIDVLGLEFFEQISKPNLDRCFAGEEVTYSGWFSTRVGRMYLWISYSPLRPNSERVDAALVITRDLTDHMLASEALRDAQAELAHVNRVATMGQLTASVAHEVNQPIAAAVINAQAALRWLEAQPPDLDEVRHALRRILDSGARAGDVIGRIRALIKKAPPNKTLFDLNEAIGDVIALTRSEAQKNGVLVHTRLASDLPRVEGDRVQLQQVVLNLIMNAIEAMSEVEQGPRELELITEADAVGGVLVSVRDTGPGLDPRAAARLFEPFYTTKAEGMGMGLAISRSIAEAHGGRLSASENEPRGAVFQLRLPARPAEDIPAARAGQMPA
jgi:PAS domain S-box-containing protein